jgi:hypothetical protein
MAQTGPTLASPPWTIDFLGREHLIPGGAKMDPAAIAANAAGKKPLPSGTAVGRTIAERDASTPFGLADAADDEVYLTAFDVDDLLDINDIELVRPNTTIKENFLPDFAGLAAGVQTKLRAAYICTRGAD